MSPVFLDTVGLIAIWNASDQWNALATAAFTEIVRRQAALVTTPAVLLECGNASARRPYRRHVVGLPKQLLTQGQLIEPTPDEIEEAWLAFDRGEAGGAGIVDPISFVVMRRLGITDAFTNDVHYVAAGFRVLF